MKTIYLTGQNNFGNRGCEALVRSTVELLRAELGDIRVLVPSADIARDSAQWPEAASLGVEWVEAPTVPSGFINWDRLCRRLPFLLGLQWPRLQPDAKLAARIRQCDAVLSIGGDNYSLDYDLASLFFFVGIAELALAANKPVILWGASVGPFSARPAVEKQLIAHLKRLSLITIRESHSITYLRERGVSANVQAVTDSAFAMTPQPLPVDGFWPMHSDEGVVGLNVSPLVEKVRAAAGEPGVLIRESAAFIRRVLAETRMSVLLVPHVAPLDGSATNNDELYLQQILAAVGEHGGRLAQVPSGLNASQLKYVISRCRFFIGARTHATIAAMSTSVPCTSIAYSVKARGINRDLFGHEDFVLPTPAVSDQSLWDHLQRLVVGEPQIKALSAERLPEWRQRPKLAAQWLARHWQAQEAVHG
ncbi:polysaccharide pyruvyl transferase family protein [Jeongeupia chitinilytica]|uniref:Polysaccharide pyruvyl transferase domain-containing protein n=1 Tax=Jeongeupia chitinilytica TaxID=1041641 RepID=A0ABQ3GV01_9NEIS|nr:polysaccharide pyruvyl transferase family protein [Jeongeupia chitinilytica]GHD56391.1 hypothetical protein GCM10007350_03400 [Jeongeupia chitinilytica]